MRYGSYNDFIASSQHAANMKVPALGDLNQLWYTTTTGRCSKDIKGIQQQIKEMLAFSLFTFCYNKCEWLALKLENNVGTNPPLVTWVKYSLQKEWIVWPKSLSYSHWQRIIRGQGKGHRRTERWEQHPVMYCTEGKVHILMNLGSSLINLPPKQWFPTCGSWPFWDQMTFSKV